MTRLHLLRATALLLLPLIATAEKAESLDEHAARAWRESRELISDVLELEDEKQTLPDSAWIRRDQKDADSDINELLDDVIDAMSVSALNDSRKEHDTNKNELREIEEKIADLGEKLVSAQDGSSLDPRSRPAIEKKIERLRKQSADIRKDQRGIIRTMKTQYAEIGVNISEDQVKFFLSSASGDNIINLSSVFNNVKEITSQLQDISTGLPEDTAMAKRYYGMYVVMVKSLMEAHESFIAEVDSSYIPKLSKLQKENEAAAAETEQLMAEPGSPQRAAILEASQETQQVTAEAIKLYREHLDDLKRRVTEGHDNMYDRYKVAENTYRTIKVAADLADVMKASVKDFNTLQEMHLPDLMPIRSEELQKKFDEITDSID